MRRRCSNKVSRFTVSRESGRGRSGQRARARRRHRARASITRAGALHFGPRRQAVHLDRRCELRAELRSSWATSTARSCASTPTAPCPPTTRSSARPDVQPADLGLRPAQPVHLRLQSGPAAAVHQRRRQVDLGRDRRGPRGRQLRLADVRRRVQRRRASSIPIYTYNHDDGPGQVDHRRRLLRRHRCSRPTTAATTSSATTWATTSSASTRRPAR